MSLTLGAVITAARDRHPAFERTRSPDAVVARYMSDLQNEMISQAVIRDRQFMAQTAVVSLAINGANAPGVAGAGTTGGVPGVSTANGFSTTESTTGSLIEVGVTSDAGAIVLIDDSPLTIATATTLTKTGAGRTVNGDVEKVLVITTGKGMGQRREVVSNTADTWTFGAWTTVPDTTSLFSLVAPAYVSDDTAGAVTALPSTTTNQGYLVKLDASGVPYIDFSQPLTAQIEQGVPLPAMAALLPDLCQYWRTADPTPCPLVVANAQQRWRAFSGPAVYVVGSTLYLCGESCDWTNVASLELRYVPVTPAFTALTDVFLLPDYARPMLVAAASSFMATRVAGMDGVTIDPSPYLAESHRATAAFFQAVLSGTRGRRSRVREVW